MKAWRLLHRARALALGAAAACTSLPAQAASLDGAALSAYWGLPFAGLLASIALVPLLAPGVWHHHHGKIAAGWALALVAAMMGLLGVEPTAAQMAHALLAEYLPFIVLLVALYTVAGGLYVQGNLHGSAELNVGLIGLGGLLASVMGTTGASMLLVRPLIRANDNRRHNTHVFVFFIFIVSNIGGSLTPLGDPPLFLGFLQGVDFFWTLQHLWAPSLGLSLVLLSVFYMLDRWYFRNDLPRSIDPTPDDATPLGLQGKVNGLLLLAILGLVLFSGLWRDGPHWTVLGVEVGAAQLVRDGALIGVTLASLALTPRKVREANQFEWGPMQEVAKLFAGIFVTIAPVLAMLQAGADGAFAPIVHAVSGPGGEPLAARYFWASGLLSSFLDNAPTYLAFFHLAGGDAQHLMGPLSGVLAAISAGSVYMGANSYIGNAPNLMVKAVAESRGVRMPSFFGYMVWSCGLLLPLFVLMTWIMF